MPPFWAFIWPGGYGITQYLLSNPHEFAGTTIIDFGCGCGSSAIAAIGAGATMVIANDIDPFAILATSLNVKLNSSDAVINNLYTTSKNLLEIGTGPLCSSIESIKQVKSSLSVSRSNICLLGDMLYDSDIGKDVLKFANELLIRGWIIYTGDPGRNFITNNISAFGLEIAKYNLPKDISDQNNGLVKTSVYRLFLDT